MSALLRRRYAGATMSIALAPLLGPAAGIGTSVCFTFTALLFTEGGKRVGMTAVNAIRIGVAIVCLALLFRITGGQWLPNATSGQVLLLAVSGLLGLCVGDQALFVSFVDIGPRRAELIMTTSPVFAILFGWLALGETLHAWAWIGIGLVLLGVAGVVSERTHVTERHAPTRFTRGLLLALVGAMCQAGGLLLSKQGMGHGWLAEGEHMQPLPATLVRMTFAGAGMIPLLVYRHTRRRRVRNDDEAQQSAGRLTAGYLLAAAGGVLGSFLGVWMSLVAADRVPVGVAQTLCSLPPVLILPLLAVMYKERITVRAIACALVAVGGAALLFFKPAG